MSRLALLPFVLLVGGATAAPRISVQSIIVNPAETSLKVRVRTDRAPSDSHTPSYAVGDRIQLSVSTNQDAYVYLFNVNPDGSVDQILPNRFASGGNFLKANTVKQFPGPGDRFTFNVSGPLGVNKVLALASKTQLNLDDVSAFRNGEPFATVSLKGQQRLAEALSIVVRPLPERQWVTDVTTYRVVND